MPEMKKLIDDFMKSDIISDENIYNEFSLQHELGIYLREKLEGEMAKVKFELNVAGFPQVSSDTELFVKKEMDLVILDADGKKFAVELKFPTNGAFPKSMGFPRKISMVYTSILDSVR